MSVFANLQATPSRMLGLLRLLAALPDQSATHDDLEALWWPRITRPDTSSVDYFGDNMRELTAVELVNKKDNDGEVTYQLSTSIPESWRSPDSIAAHGPDLFVQHLLGQDAVTRNDDLGYVLAWWLAQPLAEVPATPTDLALVWRSKIDVEAIPWRTQDTGDPLAVNEDRARQMRLWAVYFGLGWEHGTSANKTPHLQPDPTGYLRRALKKYLPDDGTEVQVDKVWERVATNAPFLDEGRYMIVLQKAGVLDADLGRSFSQSVSMALLRLEREGTVQLVRPKDASADLQRLLTWGNRRRPITHLARAVQE